MSAILGVLRTEARPVATGLARRLLDRMPARGCDRSAVWSMDGAALAVGRYEWELHDDWSGEVLVLDEGDFVIAADASIYYSKELRERLVQADARIGGTTASHLILAAYRAWGERCVEHLEGDYAFIVYDRGRRRVFCARDFGGKRPLYYADLGHTLVLASTMTAVVAHPDCPDDLNLIYLAETAGALWGSAHETAYRAVSLLPAGWSLSWPPGARPLARQDWYPPSIESARSPGFETAAIQLRELLCRAVDERLAKTGPTAVMMSGGWDSTAVFGAGQRVIRGGGRSQRLHPVSISYPPGDAGREDELISAIAQQWQTPVQWLDIRDIPLLDRPAERAATRDDPYAQPFELWNRALARGSRTVGARVAFEGGGGDQVFQVSPVFLADLFRRGRWITLMREWRALRLRGFVDFFRWALKPTLPPLLLNAATLVRGGKRLHGAYERWMPPWLNRQLKPTLEARQRLHLPARQGCGCSAYETYVYLALGSLPRANGILAGCALEEGVELRSPLYDRRVIEFAAPRPRWERASGGETKRLLRRSMQGLLPSSVLAPRPFRTGLTSDYFARETRRRLPELIGKVSHAWTLAQLGVIEPEALARGCDQYARSWDADVAMALLHTLQVELWLRARLRHSGPPAGRPASRRAAVTASSHRERSPTAKVAVAPPGEGPGNTYYDEGGDAGCTPNLRWSGSEPSGS
jgi:asparagine synthase (glutamine-hydrolysing)